MGTILTIDDDRTSGKVVMDWSTTAGHKCYWASSLSEGMQKLSRHTFDVVLLELSLPDGNGLDYIQPIYDQSPNSAIVIQSTCSEKNEITKAFELGAFDYHIKPLIKSKILKAIDNLIRLKSGDSTLYTDINREDILGESPKLTSCIEQMALAASGSGNVLVTGETGTGKELFAHAIHKNSDRCDKRFVVVDCTNLPINLAESILFGHAKGSFTGADRDRKGLFELAHQGTLFLDEIGDLDPNVQKSLLRVVQEKKFRPLSSNKEIQSDFRLVAATNRDLFALVEKGLFRRDLYYRLQAFIIDLPPLRDRNGDVKILAEQYVEDFCKEHAKTPMKLGTDFVRALKSYNWPGNIRELRNVLQVAVYKAMFEDKLCFHHLPHQLRMCKIFQDVNDEALPQPDIVEQNAILTNFQLNSDNLPALKEFRKMTVDAMEKEYLAKLLDLSDRDAKTACTLSGLSRARLYELLNKHHFSLKS